MPRLTSAEYAKTHGAAAGRQLHRERVAQFKQSEAKRRLAERRVQRSVGVGSRHDIEGKVGARLDKRLAADTKPFVTTNEWWAGHKNPKFGGWSKYDKVSAKVMALPDSAVQRDVPNAQARDSVLYGGNEATRLLNQIYKIKFPKRTSDEDKAIDRLVKLAPGLKKSHPLFRLAEARAVRAKRGGPIVKGEGFWGGGVESKDVLKEMYR